MVAPIKFLSGRQQQQKIGVIGSTEDTKVLEVIGRVGIGTTIFDTDYNLDVRGNANISGILTVGQIISGAGNSFSDLYVTGLSTFKSNVDIDASVDILDNLTVDGLSDLDELNVAGISTFGSDVDINASVDISTNLTVDGLSDLDELNVAGIATFGSDVDINAAVDISDNLTIGPSGTLSVDGLSDLDELNVAGISTFGSDVDINASVDISNNLTVDGLSDLDELNVAGIATFGSNIDANAGLDVDGLSDLDELNVAGISTFGSNVDINSSVDISNNLNVDGRTDLEQLNVAGLSTFTFNVDINAAVDISDNLTIGPSGTLSVDGLSDLDELNVAGIATFGSDVDINASVDISNNLNVTGVSTFQGNVYLGDLDVINIGDSNDLQIYHDGSTSGIIDNTVGNLIIRNTAPANVDSSIFIRARSDENSIIANDDGSVELYYDNSKKLETTGVGVSIVNGTSDTATIYGPSNLIIDPMPIGVGTTSGVVRIKGDLYVDGTQFVVASSTIELADFVVGIATTVPNDIVLDGAGIGIGTNKTFLYEYNSGNNPSLKSSENLNVASGKHYQIGEVEVLSSTTLGSGVVNSILEL
jgi:cytoskeletal protein CcmA (bactofilin family)